MRRIITILLLFVSLVCSAQLPEKVKCLEMASTPADTMILINKPDLDKINTTFYRLEVADSLNAVNDEIISTLTSKADTLEEISDSQKQIIENQQTQIEDIKKKNLEVITDLESQVKRANTEKAFSNATMLAGIIAIFFIAGNK